MSRLTNRLRDWWHTRHHNPDAARLRAALHHEGYRTYPLSDAEWRDFTRSHHLHLRTPDRVDRLIDDALHGDHEDDGDEFTRDWTWP